MFLEKILTPTGLYCVALLLNNGGFRHFFYKTIQEAEQQITALTNTGHNVYIAQASFNEAVVMGAREHNKKLPRGLSPAERARLRKKERSQANAVLLKNFFLDIDCGEKWPLKNQQEGVIALKQFLADTGLPMPAVINSGNGLYAHWLLEEAIPAHTWKATAGVLKKVVAEYSPAIGGDSSRTSDSASVLRPPGSYNRKPGHAEKLVSIVKDVDPIPFDLFAGKLRAAAAKKKLRSDVLAPPKPSTDLNADFYVQQDTPHDANKVADKCRQLGAMRESRGDMVEPVWYACIGLLAFCVDGDKWVHEWSKGHPGYSPGETEAKLDQWRASGMGPTTCVKFGGDNPEGCIGCPHNGKIKSPIVLGRPEPVVRELPSTETESVPQGFRRADDGLFLQDGERWFRFYDQDLWVDGLAYDESLGYEVMRLKHTLPHEGELECILRSSLVNDQKALMIALADNHIKVVGMKEKKCMATYIESYQATLQRQRRMTKLLCQMGWKDGKDGTSRFVLGRKIYYSNGTIEDASLAKNVPSAAKGYHSKGSLEKWVATTEMFSMRGMEPFAFGLLAGAFGAPLIRSTGYEGALVSMVGDSGVGKTLLLRMIQSVWGNHNDLMMLRDDTHNAIMSRLGVYNSLPMTLDEITNMDGIELSNFVYRATHGRDKARLNKNSEERDILNSWNTVVVTSSNSSLIDKLSGVKHDASAEMNRVFEYTVPRHPYFQKQVASDLYWTIHNNYGLAGEVYAKWLVQNTEWVKEKLELLRTQIDSGADIKGEERFWGAIASAAILGGVIAQDLGLIRFPISNVMTWVSNTIKGMRGHKMEMTGDAISILGQFIDEHASNRLLVKGSSMSKRGCTIVETPKGQLVMRFELDTMRLYISRAVFKSWLARKFGSYAQVKTDLQEIGALTSANKRKTLGAGTFFGGVQQPCWEINMNCKALGPDFFQIVQAARMLEQNPIPGEESLRLPSSMNPDPHGK